MEEIWKDIVGYEGLYQVSNHGRVRSLDREIAWKGTWRFYKGKVMKQRKDKDGYLTIQLYKNGNRKDYFVHRLVALAFIPNVDSKKQVNHLDGRNDNNHVSNLEWASENNQHCYDTGLRDSLNGERHINAKLKETDVLIIRLMLDNGILQRIIAQKFGVTRSIITRIKSKKLWSHI
jgi:NUMOD4 motif/HNH endonuclease